MRKLFLFVLLCVMPAAAFAQKETGVFFGGGAGMNFGFDGLKFDDRPSSHNGAGYAGDFWAGGWIDPTIGLRAGYQGFSISDRYTDFGNRKYNYAHADVLLRAHRNIIPYVHAGWLRIVKPSWGGGAGMTFPIHLTKHVAIVPDFRATFYGSRAFASKDKNIAMTLSATIGIALRFGGKSQPKKAPDTQIITVPVHTRDTVVVTRVERDTVQQVIRDTVYIAPPEEEIREPETISALALFDTDKYVLRLEVLPELNKIVAWFVVHPTAKAVIEGHTDSTASPEYNQTLSERRAKAVYDYLVEYGINPDRLTWVGYGLTRPVDTNSTPEGRQKNRRVEIHVE